MKKLFLLCLLLAVIQVPIWAQKPLTIEDAFNPQLNPKTLRGIQWMGTSNKFAWFESKGSEDFLIISSPSSKKKDTVLRATELQYDFKRFPALTFIDDIQFFYTYKAKVYLFNLKTKSQAAVNSFDEKAENLEIDPINFHVAYTKGENAFVSVNNTEYALSNDNKPGVVNGVAVHRNEFGIKKGLFWSENGSYIAWYRMDESMVTDYPLVELESAPAKVKLIKYPMAGQTSHIVKVGVYNIKTNKSIFLTTGEPNDQYLTNVAFTPDEKFVTVAIVNREQDQMKLNMYDANTGEFVRTLIDEKDPKYVEPENPPLFVSTKNNEFIWQSERDGTNQLYLYNTNGEMLRKITEGKSTVTNVYGTNYSGSKVWFQVATNDGLDREIFVADIKKGKAKSIGTVSGTVTAYFSDDKNYYLSNYSSPTVPRVIAVMDNDGKEKQVLLTADNPLVNFYMPRSEVIKLRALDSTILNARIIKPINFDPEKKYPVVVYVYGGPHAQLVTNNWLTGANLWMNYMASEGYIVFTIDNRGSSGRGQAFESATHRRLGSLELEDQLVGVEWLKTRPYVNQSRIGVHGWSFGGFMTTTMLTKAPDVFKVGVAGGPVMDWSLYEIMYTERYMDTPQENPDGYAAANLLNQAKNLNKKLMLIHGTVDDVVVWQHSQAFVQKCVESGKLVDYMIYPGHAHNVVGKDRIHLYKTVTRYLKDNL
jgi:dipeptidyl-peptidase-4